MRCPDCDNTLVQNQTDRGVVHQCDKCFGMWFDRDEFNQYSLWLACERKLGAGKPLFRTKPASGVDGMQDMPKLCPVCHEKLTKKYFADYSNILIDKCEICKGVWTNDVKMRMIVLHIQNDPEVDKICRGVLNSPATDEIEKISSLVEALKSELGSWV